MGKIIVITGTMFAGKTTKLISMVEELRKKNKNFSVYRPQVNIVDGKGVVLTHDNLCFPAKPLTNFHTLVDDESKYIFIDSFQNLHYSFVDLIENLSVKQNKEFYLFGTRTDIKGNFQQTMCKAMSIADDIILLKAKCADCRNDAIYQVLCDGMKLDDDINKIGNKEKYKPLCRECFFTKIFPKNFI